MKSSRYTAWTGQYYPFGELTVSSSYPTPMENTHGFTGKELDSEMDQNYSVFPIILFKQIQGNENPVLRDFCQRYYDPQIGRFMSLDPFGGYIELPQSQNRYAYVMNNPLKYIDPLGLWNEVEERNIDVGYQDRAWIWLIWLEMVTNLNTNTSHGSGLADPSWWTPGLSAVSQLATWWDTWAAAEKRWLDEADEFGNYAYPTGYAPALGGGYYGPKGGIGGPPPGSNAPADATAFPKFSLPRYKVPNIPEWRTAPKINAEAISATRRSLTPLPIESTAQEALGLAGWMMPTVERQLWGSAGLTAAAWAVWPPLGIGCGAFCVTGMALWPRSVMEYGIRKKGVFGY